MSKEELLNKRTQILETLERLESDEEFKHTVAGCSLYSRVSGYYRNVESMNTGKQQEVKERTDYVI